MDMDNYEGDDFHPSIEPMVIINSQDDEEENVNFKNGLSDPLGMANEDSSQDSQKSLADTNEILTNIGPEITIFPVKKKTKPSFKIRLFGNHYLNQNANKKKEERMMFDDEYDVHHNDTKSIIVPHIRSPGIRTPVRLISKDEAEMAEDPYAKRKSSPLEKCPICKKFFRRMKTHLLKHEILQNQEVCAGLICDICNKAFNNQSNLQIHMRTHTGDKPYICEVCNKSFSQSCNLVNHMRIHTGEKPFKCPHCDRAFTQSGNLNNHIRLHTDDKPFKCHFCDKAFVQSGNLNSHIRNNHRIKGYIPIKPEIIMS